MSIELRFDTTRKASRFIDEQYVPSRNLDLGGKHCILYNDTTLSFQPVLIGSTST